MKMRKNQKLAEIIRKNLIILGEGKFGKRGWQLRLSEEMNVPPSLISRWTRGHSSISEANLVRCAKALDTTVSSLMGGEKIAPAEDAGALERVSRCLGLAGRVSRLQRRAVALIADAADGPAATDAAAGLLADWLDVAESTLGAVAAQMGSAEAHEADTRQRSG